MTRDSRIMGICGETHIANEKDSWVTMVQVFKYFISHQMAKAFESVFGSVTCLPGSILRHLCIRRRNCTWRTFVFSSRTRSTGSTTSRASYHSVSSYASLKNAIGDSGFEGSEEGDEQVGVGSFGMFGAEMTSTKSSCTAALILC
ncbi:chitin synthase-domain-containing protein [Cladochytrium replicatum]|nr:chitin synthase-domain-containing protein [Cladochytrium replicatum]